MTNDKSTESSQAADAAVEGAGAETQAGADARATEDAAFDDAAPKQDGDRADGARADAEKVPAAALSKTEKPARPTRSGLSPAVAVLVGAVGAAIGAGGAYFALEAQGAAEQTALSQRLQTFEAELERRVASRLEGVNGRVDQVEAALAPIDQRLTALAAGSRALDERLATSEAALTRVSAEATTAVNAVAAAETARAALAAEQDRLAAAMASVDPAAAVSAAPSGGVGADAAEALGQRLSALETGVRRLETQVNGMANDLASGLASGPSAAAAAVDATRLDALERGVAEIAAVRTEVTALDARLSARVSALEDADARVALGQTGLAFGALSQAVSRSAPFAAQLDAFEAQAAGSAAPVQVGPALRAAAASGLKSPTVLAMEFDEACRDALEAIAEANVAASRDEGVLSTIGARLSSLVVVRRVGSVDGDEPSAILARAEVKVDAGELEAALEEIASLPDAGKDADRMRSWIEEAQARVAAEAELAAMQLQLPAASDGE